MSELRKHSGASLGAELRELNQKPLILKCLLTLCGNVDGYRKGAEVVYCVPLVRKENGQNTVAFLQQQFGKLFAVYDGNIRLRLAARYRMDEELIELLQRGEVLTLVERRQLLVDVSPITGYAGL